VPVTNRDEMKDYIETALRLQQTGDALPFATIDKTSNKPAGSTRFGEVAVDNRRVEIGWTWLGPQWQRTVMNTEAKYLMLTHAFDTWGCARVELKTDAMNDQSRSAILRIGAKEEGILRKHMLTSSGRFRDTVYYSILDDEWPDVRKWFLEKLKR
jgi:RimJ/RimL family protein N-acetyltransferase